MANTITPFAPQRSEISIAGQSQIVFLGPMNGGLLVNPYSAAGEGIPTIEPLYVSLTGPANLFQNGTTFAIQPGGYFRIPPGTTTNVWVNAATGGHKFSGFVLHEQPPFIPSGAIFPPGGPTSLTKLLPSYLYEEYYDDSDLQSFVDAFNAMSQKYVDWFNDINLPVYTSELVQGALLDWVAWGLYGMTRPALPSGKNVNIGPYNTILFNQVAIDEEKFIGNQNLYATSDDTFKRILTWHLYKGDGKVFDIRWLKRRVMRFLFGENGVDYNVDQTYPVSVSFAGDQVNIRIGAGIRRVTGGALYNRFNFNTMDFNELLTSFIPSPAIPEAIILKAAIDSGACELPFQFTYVVTVG